MSITSILILLFFPLVSLADGKNDNTHRDTPKALKGRFETPKLKEGDWCLSERNAIGKVSEVRENGDLEIQLYEGKELDVLGKVIVSPAKTKLFHPVQKYGAFEVGMAVQSTAIILPYPDSKMTHLFSNGKAIIRWWADLRGCWYYALVDTKYLRPKAF